MHIQSRLTCIIPCAQLSLGPVHTHPSVLGLWSLIGYMKDGDVSAVTALAELEGEEEELEADWDAISKSC